MREPLPSNVRGIPRLTLLQTIIRKPLDILQGMSVEVTILPCMTVFCRRCRNTSRKKMSVRMRSPASMLTSKMLYIWPGICGPALKRNMISRTLLHNLIDVMA